MDEQSDEPLLFQQDLTCPVCQGIFRDPVLLPCTHTFCRQCVDRCFEVNNNCPVCREPCRKEQAISNRALSDTCESFLQQAVRLPKHPKSEGVCNLHVKPLDLYCEKDEDLVCVDCVPLHTSHRLLTIKDGVPICRKEISFKINIFEKKVETYKKMTQNFSQAAAHIKDQAEQTELQIRAEFERLREVLNKEERERLTALSQEEEDKVKVLNELSESTKKDIVALEELIDMLKKEMGNEDLLFLKNFQSLKRKAQWTKKEPCFGENCILNTGEHVGALSFNIWKNMQSHVEYYPVVFDPNTASPWLAMNANLTTVKESSELLTTPDNPERFDPCVFVLGNKGYTSGKHRWDVIVGDIPKWVLGVCSESVARKKKFTVSTTRGVWCISLSKGVYAAMTPERTDLAVQRRPEKIRIKLNMDTGEVSFWDAETAKHLVTLSHKFEGKMFPIFGPGLHSTPMTLAPGKKVVHTS